MTDARVMRARIAASAAPSVTAGSTRCAGVPLPDTGSHPSITAKTIASSGPSQNPGIEMPASASVIDRWSRNRPRNTAATIPIMLAECEKDGRLKRGVKVAMVAFDENEATLQGIVDGHIHGTVVQNPYEYGHASIALLARLAREHDPARRAALLPPGGFLDIPARRIVRDNVRAFWDDLKQKTGKK